MGKNIRGHLMLVLAALLAPGLAQAVSESEPNHPIGQPQELEVVDQGSGLGGATVDGVIGNLSGTPVADLDYFSFEGTEGDVVTLDIDMGMGGARSVDTIMAVFGPGPAYAILRLNDDGGLPLDSGSISRLDSRITNFRLPATGSYVVGVSGYPRRFVNGGGVSSNTVGASGNGDYTLLVTGVTVPVMQINIEIKPGSGDVAPINPKSKGKIPVALLGSSQFVVTDVDQASLGFGHSGNERSLFKCGDPDDVNGDAFPDLVCHFQNQVAGWDSSDDEGIVKGKLDDGRKFEGRAWLKVVPVKSQD